MSRWGDRTYVPRSKLRKSSAERRAAILQQPAQSLEDSPVLSALGWTVHARRGRYYFEEDGEVVGRITPTGSDELFIDFEQMSGSGSRFSGRCLYAQRGGESDACRIKPNQAASTGTLLVRLEMRDRGAW